MTDEIRKILEEIADFYEDKKGALTILTSRFSTSGQTDPEKLRQFRQAERELHEKRLRNRIPRSVTLLEIALDDSPFTRSLGGRTLGQSAYQAERYYSG